MTFGASAGSHSYNIPVVDFDGTHSRPHKLNGVILSIIGRDGNGQNVMLATAFVNVENKDKISWFFIHCINAGINLVNVAIMCNHGKIQDAAKQVFLITSISLQNRFCTLPICATSNEMLYVLVLTSRMPCRKFSQQSPRSTTTLLLRRYEQSRR